MGDSGSCVDGCCSGPWRGGRSSEDGSAVQSNCAAIERSEHVCSGLESGADAWNFSDELARYIRCDVGAERNACTQHRCGKGDRRDRLRHSMRDVSHSVGGAFREGLDDRRFLDLQGLVIRSLEYDLALDVVDRRTDSAWWDLHRTWRDVWPG